MLNTEESRKGAMACLQAMQAVKQLKYQQESQGTNKDYFDYLSAENNEILKAAGNQPDFMTGFITSLAEILSDAMLEYGVFDVFVWKPEATMTDEQIAVNRARYD
jgi:hypothetical protein